MFLSAVFLYFCGAKVACSFAAQFLPDRFTFSLGRWPLVRHILVLFLLQISNFWYFAPSSWWIARSVGFALFHFEFFVFIPSALLFFGEIAP
jgi:hypothetical protein